MQYLLYLTIISAGLIIAAHSASAGIIIRPVFNSGLVGYWDFQEGEGSIAYNRSGNLNNGALTNMATSTNGGWTDSKSGLGQALSFDGSDDYIEIPNSGSLDIAGDKVTMTAWVRDVPNGNGTTQQAVINRGPEINTERYWLGFNTAWNTLNLEMRVYANGSKTAYTSATNSFTSSPTWKFIAGVYNGATMKGYVNCNLIKVVSNGKIKG